MTLEVASEIVARAEERRVTEWLKTESAFDESCYEVVNNIGWCRCEVKRLKEKGIAAGVIMVTRQCENFTYPVVAVVKLGPGESLADLQKAYNMVEA